MGSEAKRDPSHTRERIPPHLRQYVVHQDLTEYNEIDQAVWRFVLLQLHTRLQATAHSAYVEGLAAAGIGVERIPSIDAMDALLAQSGWGAVCVDGFIPPLAFQEFQALGILPISANMRSLDHLVYTPAPDIIHEAAGHAPILSDLVYADYLRKIGRAGALAFSSREDARLYRTVFTLSELKEEPNATQAQLVAAESAVREAQAQVLASSEAARLSRLYWWTAEYGLIGRCDDYRLYGAGLLSSLAESHFCHDASVKKFPLSPMCLDVPFDITKPQPQLFVARDFEQLHEVLQDAEASLAHALGGSRALTVARASGELATLEFEHGPELIGQVVDFGGSEQVEWVAVAGPLAWVTLGQIAARSPALEEAMLVPIGKLRGTSSEFLSEGEFCRIFSAIGGEVELEWDSGFRCRGIHERTWLNAEGFVFGVTLGNFLLTHAGSPEHTRSGDHLELGLVSTFRTLRRGASCSDFYPPTQFSERRIPKRRIFNQTQQSLLGLYERAVLVFRSELGSRAAQEFETLYRRLQQEFPGEWLLRWNLLECLLKLDFSGPLRGELLSDLEDLEIRYQHRQPVASGLRYLEGLVRSGSTKRD